MRRMDIKNKWFFGIMIGAGICLFVWVVIPSLREKQLYEQLSNIDISPILINAGDLPAGFTAGGITEVDPYYYESAQAKLQKIFATDGTEVGAVSVYLFASSSEQSGMSDRYSQVESQEGIIPYEVTRFGDQSSVFSISGCDIRVVFIRCTALGVIEMDASCKQKDYDFDS